jgi:non-ribosomal peptide synthase protein (TIGR01720 family)
MVLPLKTDSYQRWTKKLQEYALSGKLLSEKHYWKAITGKEIMPIQQDKQYSSNYRADAKTLSVSLSKELTHALLIDVHSAYGTTINDMLLTGLLLAINNLWGNKKIAIDLEAHGREEIMEDVDVSRTIGWFTSIYPVVLDLLYKGDMGLCIKEVKECLRAVPEKGIGYGILKYLSHKKDIHDLPFILQPQISFNYLGQYDHDIAQTRFKAAAESAGKTQGDKIQRAHLLEVTAIVSDGSMVLIITFNKEQFNESTIHQLLSVYNEQLDVLTRHCRTREKRTFTPSDYGNIEFTVDELDSIFDND